jgi:hypothetical protein
MPKPICLVVISLFSLTAFSAEVGVNAKVSLTPAGGFVAHTKDVQGSATINDGLVSARNIHVKLKSIVTGISLRDVHTQKHMETDRFPDAILVVAKGKAGKGRAKIKFHGIVKTVPGTYSILDEGHFLRAEFPISLKEFGITGIRYMGVGVKDQVKVDVTLPLKSGS